MARGDFHLHSTCSDGILSPAEVIARAAGNGVTVLALTDHDTTAGVAAALDAGRVLGVRVIPGVELSADLPDGGDAHLLGYFATVENKPLQDQLAAYREGRMRRGQVMLTKLEGLKMPLEWERLLEIAGEAAVGRPHVARAMVERGYVASVREAFDRYLYTDGPADAQREKLPPEEALDLIAQAGGVSVLAHPSYLPDAERTVAALTAQGLQGIEVYYKNYPPDVVDGFRQLADRHGLLPLGGSDYHGIHDDEREPGDIPLPDQVIDRFLHFAEARWEAGAQKPAHDA